MFCRDEFRLNLPPIGKARPRVTHNGTFMPKEYQRWMSAAVLQLQKQWTRSAPVQTADCLTIYLYGQHRRGDIDNMAGSVMDALVKAKILANDGVRNVPALHVEWHQWTTPYIHLLLTHEQADISDGRVDDAVTGDVPG